MSSSTTQPVQPSLFTSERGENKGRIWQQHLDWTAKQGRILTDSGNALQYYCEDNGFPFSHEELPHYHVERGDSNYVFRKWSQEAIQRQENPTQKYAVDVAEGVSATTLHVSPIIGVWKRPLFTGKWEHSTEDDEIVYNVQTGTLFVDLRIPRSKSLLKWDMLGEGTTRNHITAGNSHHNSRQILESMSDDDLRLYARQHVFGGFSVLTMEDAKTNKGLPICTRHHCIDWNYIPGKPRPRPNKWFIEGKNNGALPFEVWKEWSYATDENSQCYYWERWERIIGDEMGKGLRLALRKRNQNKEDGIHTDGILVVVGVRLLIKLFGCRLSILYKKCAEELLS